MSKYIIYTTAYNAEKTIRRAIDSVLNQTHTDFIYYVLDNAATDSTYEIIKEYAKHDKRIVPLHNEKSWGGNGIYEVLKNYSKDCYFCALDADDEYAPDFLEKMLLFIKNENLDIAACGSNFVDMQTNKHLGMRLLKNNLILDGEEFDRYFPTYHQFMRTIWGKVYSVSVLHRSKFKKYTLHGYGYDTLFATNAFYNANRVGIISETLHKYYISSKSVSYQFDEGRIASDRILFDAACDFLISKCGAVSDENLNFLWIVYFNAIKDTLNVLLNAQIGLSDKLDYLLDIFQSQHTQELIKWPGVKAEKNQLFRQLALWMLSKEEFLSGSGFDIVIEILISMDIYPNKIKGWKDEEVYNLLTMIRDKQIERDLPNNADSHIISVASKSPYLVGLEVGFLCYFKDIVSSILQNDEENALSQIIELIAEGTEIPDEYAESLILMALNLSAKLELHDYFIYFKKLQISLLIELSKINEAIEEFADWDKILSDDIDFKNLKERLGI